MIHCNIICRQEQAPVTDEQWAYALRDYGSDRPSSSTESKAEDTPLGLQYPMPPPGCPYAMAKADETRPLIHDEAGDDDELPPQDLHLYDGNTSSNNDNQSAEWRQRLNRQFSWSNEVRVLGGTAADGSRSTTPSIGTPSSTPFPTGTRTPPSWAWPIPQVARPDDSIQIAPQASPSNVSVDSLVGSEEESDSGNVALLAAPQPSLMPQKSVAAFERNYGDLQYDSVGVPRPVNPSECSGLCAEAERRRLRTHYEEHGWLPAPNPSHSTRVARCRAIRRLGLNDRDEEGERFLVIAKYAELAQMVFGTRRATILILKGDEAAIYGEDPVCETRQPLIHPAHQPIGGHAVLSHNEEVMVIANAQEDWRFRNNPVIQEAKIKFFAGAPLRYHRTNGDSVDFGALCLLGDEERDTFDAREQGILLRMANMLVFQLATLQSEIMAKRSSSMYESSINFLRRSLVPDHLKPESSRTSKSSSHDDKPKEKKRHSDSVRDRRRHGSKSGGLHRPALHLPQTRQDKLSGSHHGSHHSSAHHTPGHATPTNPPVVPISKSGPSDSKSSKRRDLLAEKAMFDDAATTLRGILGADAVSVVDLHEHQLFMRKSGSKQPGQPRQSKESIMSDFLQGRKWPSNIEPVVTYVPHTNSTGITVLGKSITPGFEHDFAAPDAAHILSRFIKSYLTTRHFWWDREDESDHLAKEVMSLMSDNCQTVLATVFMGFDGSVRYATFASWARPPSAFDDSSRLALPFVWIIGATLISSLAFRRMRKIEHSQISYSNLQAHELRTPLHQILAITQLLRSSMSDLAEAPPLMPIDTSGSCPTTLQQIRDLLPFLDAIDTSGKTLHGIVENILSFLDLKAKDARWDGMHGSHHVLSTPSGAPQKLGAVLEEIITEAYDEDNRARRGSGHSVGHIETVFEIIPDGLGDMVTEDSGGALRKALGKIIGNAYRYIEGEGCVEIYVNNVTRLLPPEGCEDFGPTRRVSIQIIDNGRGMALDFIREKLGEPWAKEDLYATGSGLSVHLAYRIIDLIGGQMEITSAPGMGTTVTIEVPLQNVLPLTPDSQISDPAESLEVGPSGLHSVSKPASTIGPKRKVALVGFAELGERELDCHYERLGESLARQYQKFGCEIVPIHEADLVVTDGDYETTPAGAATLSLVTAPNMVMFMSKSDPSESRNWVKEERTATTTIRRFRKPVTPSIIKETLTNMTPQSGANSPLASTPGFEDKARPRTHFDEAALGKGSPCPATQGLRAICSKLGWKPKGIQVEDAVASLCLGDYFSSRSRITRAPSNASSAGGGSTSGAGSDSASLDSPLPFLPGLRGRGDSPPTTPSESSYSFEQEVVMTPVIEPIESLPPPPPKAQPTVKVLVVEDNIINRKILVKILTAKVPSADIVEAENGRDGVDRFREVRASGAGCICVMDINMPIMSGFAAATEMRLIERQLGEGIVPAKIIAVTALADEDSKRRGLIECGMDLWLTKPCPKATLQASVDQAKSDMIKLLV